ncbi:MAG: pilus assembly protein PilM [bacterium]|jgi:Tfp pilus assembly PilM family ATPase
MKTDLKIPFGKTVLAVEPGSEWFKLVEISRNRDEVKVVRVIVRRAAEVESLAGPNLLKALGIGELAGEPVVICLPRQAVNVRLFDLPSGDPQEIADMVDLQIARQTPYSRDEIVFDYRVFRSDKDGYTRVMLVIAQTGIVRQKYRFIEDAGLSVSMVTTTTDGWLAALQDGKLAFSQRLAGAAAFLDVDMMSSDLVVLNQGVPLFSRSLSVGASQLLAGDEPSRDKAVQEISMALETFRNEVPSVSIVAVALAGTAGGNQSFVKLLTSVLGVEIIPVTGAGADAYDKTGPEAATVVLTGIIGAAAAPERLQINLTPESVRLRKSVMVKARQLTMMAMLIMAVVGLMSLFVVSRINRQQVCLNELNIMIRQTTADADRIDAMSRKVVLVSERMAISMTPARALVELLGLAPETMAFTSIQISEASQLVCRGSAETVADTVRLVNSMEVSLLFQNVKNTRTVSGKDRTEFEIACELEKKRP